MVDVNFSSGTLSIELISWVKEVAGGVGIYMVALAIPLSGPLSLLMGGVLSL